MVRRWVAHGRSRGPQAPSGPTWPKAMGAGSPQPRQRRERRARRWARAKGPLERGRSQPADRPTDRAARARQSPAEQQTTNWGFGLFGESAGPPYACAANRSMGMEQPPHNQVAGPSQGHARRMPSAGKPAPTKGTARALDNRRPAEERNRASANLRGEAGVRRRAFRRGVGWAHFTASARQRAAATHFQGPQPIESRPVATSPAHTETRPVATSPAHTETRPVARRANLPGNELYKSNIRSINRASGGAKNQPTYMVGCSSNFYIIKIGHETRDTVCHGFLTGLY